ncbi:MAG: hypothetical protein WC701_12975 [Kiritimatiellales bacterium]
MNELQLRFMQFHKATQRAGLLRGADKRSRCKFVYASADFAGPVSAPAVTFRKYLLGGAGAPRTLNVPGRHVPPVSVNPGNRGNDLVFGMDYFP